GHNFVLAHESCNRAKADHPAAAEYLAAWAERNASHQVHLAEAFTRQGVRHDLTTSLRITECAYQQAFAVGGLTWQRKEELVALQADWQQPLLRLRESLPTAVLAIAARVIDRVHEPRRCASTSLR